MLTRRGLCAAAAASAVAWRSPAAAPGPGPAVRRRVLLDTDIGSDIDDAVALAYLLRQPGCELLGITTVTGDAAGRAALASALCDAAGASVPIFPGAERPLRIAQMQTEAPQVRRLPGARPQFPRGRALDFLRETIRRYPGEVTLLAVGPLTNVASLFAADPELPRLLHSLVLMGGKYSAYPTPWGPTEWNAIVDPHATAAVLAAPVPALVAFGLDITWQVAQGPQEVAAHFRGDPLLELVLDWSEVWFAERELLHFHDPLAAVWLWEPSVCTLERGSVEVALGGETPGVTRFTADPDGALSVAVAVDPERFFAAYYSVFGAGAGRPPGTTHPVDSPGGRL